jgi:hypothetical protein
MDVRADEPIDHEIAHEAGIFVLAAKNDVRLEAEAACSDCRRAAVVGLDPSNRDHCITPLVNGVGHKEFELPHLIATEFGSRAIVSFDQDLCGCWHARQSPAVQRRWKVRQHQP